MSEGLLGQSIEPVTPRHLWTNGGSEVLIVRFVAHDGTSREGFKHPIVVGESVSAPDWDDPRYKGPKCGGGIHGWPWAFSLGDGKECEWSALWLVYGVDPKDVVGGEWRGIGDRLEWRGIGDRLEGRGIGDRLEWRGIGDRPEWRGIGDRHEWRGIGDRREWRGIGDRHEWRGIRNGF